ncbi:MAG: transcriptional regulator MraZ [Gammaproteobacteria bacterium]|nr:MAG: transcriptional regulator MraZ [Gammaproteobacteria bacterium]|tara:strand:+ start:380 stop:829 length:450 start_codon:yes stop_codon:yes gene_type:complete
MFRGATKVTLDAKGRLAIPTRYRDRILSRSNGEVVVTVDRDYCLLIYPYPDWEEIERKLIRLPTMNKQARRLQRLMVGYATEMELDGNGRILISKELREFANLDRQAILLGQGKKFELWNDKSWSDKRDSWLNMEDEIGLSGELDTLSL